jgi:hypothetical protein
MENKNKRKSKSKNVEKASPTQKRILLLYNYSNYILFSFLGVLIFVFLFYRLMPKVFKSDENFFYQTEQSYLNWKNSSDDLSRKEFDSLLSKNQSLLPKYQGKSVQAFIEKKEINKAISESKNVIDRIETESPFHIKFSQITLLISQNMFAKALEGSYSLKELIKNKDQNKDYSILGLYNLLRIALLENKLKSYQKELICWEELENLIQKDKLTTSNSLANILSDQKKSNLMDYISFRKEKIIHKN